MKCYTDRNLETSLKV